jgi:hypothetical protein
MVSKPERGRYLTLEDVRVSYKHKDDTVHLTSADPDIPNGSFYITLNRDTPTEEALRELLIEHGYIKEDTVVSTPEETHLDSIYSYYPRNPLQDLLVDSLVGRGLLNSPRYIHISGSPGSGKSFLAANTAEEAVAMGMTTYVVTMDMEQYLTKIRRFENQYPVRIVGLKNLPDGSLNPFSLGLSQADIFENIMALVAYDSAADFFKAVDQALLKKALESMQNIHQKSLDVLLETLETLIKTSEVSIPDSSLLNALIALKKSTFGNLLFGQSDYFDTLEPDQNTIFWTGELAHSGDRVTKDDFVRNSFVTAITHLLYKVQKTTPSLLILENTNSLINNTVRLIRSMNITLVTVEDFPIPQSSSLYPIANQMIGHQYKPEVYEETNLPLKKLGTGDFFWKATQSDKTEFYRV